MKPYPLIDALVRPVLRVGMPRATAICAGERGAWSGTNSGRDPSLDGGTRGAVQAEK